MICSVTPTFLPEPPAAAPPGAIGIARMAAESAPGMNRNEVDYRWIQCRSTLNRVNGSRVTFEWSINPYRGCEFGCAYCYARYTHEYMNHEGPDDFERIIYMKRHAAELLNRELARGKCPEGETIAIGGATDPYQPAEKKCGVTRSILEVLSRYSGLRVGITSKSDLILRDLNLLKRISRRSRLSINITITTIEAKLARLLEPRAPTPRRRLESARMLNEAGIRAGVILAPIMPGINDSDENLEAVVRAASEARAAFVIYQILFLTSCSKRKFGPFIREHFPRLASVYERFYSDGADAPDEYRAEIRTKMRRLLDEYKLERKPEAWDEAGPDPAECSRQLDLF